MTNTILVGDIGGTKTRLALAEVSVNQVNLRAIKQYASADFECFEYLLADFLRDHPVLQQVALGIAGPIQGRRVQTTNLPWLIDADVLCQQFGFQQVHLLNDLEAVAYGLPALADADVWVLQAGAESAQGNQAVIAAGTGLGEAGLFWDGQRHCPFATEGGHTSFAPANADQFALLQYLQQSYSHVSWERIVSGMGIRDLYRFLLSYRQQTTPAWLELEMARGDVGAVISQAALNQSDVLCQETLSWFLSLYGAEAGNLALKTMSRGGLFIAGGIAPKILPLLKRGEFMQAFLHKGRMSPLLVEMPVKVVLNQDVSLFGPALFANRTEWL